MLSKKEMEWAEETAKTFTNLYRKKGLVSFGTHYDPCKLACLIPVIHVTVGEFFTTFADKFDFEYQIEEDYAEVHIVKNGVKYFAVLDNASIWEVAYE